MTSAIVVGGSGFLGRSLLKVLGRRGVGTYVGKPFAGGIQLDATLEARLPANLSHVFILYEAVNPDLCARDPQATRQINVDSIVRLIEDCFARGLTPVFMSTDYVYDRRLNKRFGDELRSATTE